MKKADNKKCPHGNFNCLLCPARYFPTTHDGFIQLANIVGSSTPISQAEAAFLESKIMTNLPAQLRAENQATQPNQMEGGDINDGSNL